MNYIHEIKQLIQQNKVTDLQMLEIAECLVDNCVIRSDAWRVMDEACFEMACDIETAKLLAERERQDEERIIHKGY